MQALNSYNVEKAARRRNTGGRKTQGKGRGIMNLATAEQMRRLDRIAIEERGIPSIDLMERAAEGVAQAVLELLPDKPRRCRAAVFCGTGNNGGDGLAAARLLHIAGVQVRVLLVGDYEKLTADARTMAGRLSEFGLELEPYREDAALWNDIRNCHVLVDALFGVGLSRPITDPVRWEVIRRINEAPGVVVAADIASGVESNTGRVLGTAVRADRTVTFTLPKIGQFVGDGVLHSGAVTVHDIGLPADLVRQEAFTAKTVERDWVKRALPLRPADGHKGTFGKVLILAGSVGYTGAPVLAARAATRCGCGLVSLGVPNAVYPIVAQKCMEEMPFPLPSDYKGIRARAADSDAVLVGPGLGRASRAQRLVLGLAEELEGPLVLDADGINALEKHMDILEGRRDRVTILTPHDGEFARLGGDLSGGDRLAAARRFAETYGCILVLKGHRTIVASPQEAAGINTTGNSGMAKGGSGDVLAGILTSLLAQGMDPEKAARAAVWLHGRAGDLCAASLTEYAMTPSDMIGRLPAVFRELLEG